MLQTLRGIREVEASATPLESVLAGSEPCVLRGLVSQWPVVRAGLESPQAAHFYLRRFDRGATVGVMSLDAAAKGRFFYNDDLSGFNFRSSRARFDAVLDELARVSGQPDAPTFYMGSTTIDAALPGFRGENDVNLGGRTALASIWMGNRTRIAAHHDLPDNLACVAVGHRRFTLFPPEQIGNLYIGPLEFTPAGQPISLVDFAAPDYDRFPKFAEALKVAQVAELGPGDAIFIPSMWWHHIESLDEFNVLVNYWWRDPSTHLDSPITALMMALMSVRDLPPNQRETWRALFDHYVFEANEQTAAHIPEKARRALGKLDANTMRELRANILSRINR